MPSPVPEAPEGLILSGTTRPVKAAGALETLGRRIASGAVAEGATLPTEPELMADLGVSRSTVREAVRTLIALGMVEARPRLGTRVRPRRDWALLSRDVLRWLSPPEAPDPELLIAISEARLVFEPAAAALAATRARAAETAALRAAYQAMEAAAARGAVGAAIVADRAFHLAVLEATHNPVLRAFDSAIDTLLGVLFRITTNHMAGFRDNLGNHRRVLEAIAAGDGEGARQAMVDTITHTEADLQGPAARGAGRSEGA